MKMLNSFAEIAPLYDAFLCDLWGVIHDGEYLYPDVLEALEALYGEGKKLIFLSNAPRSADSVIQKMKAMGVKREWYDNALTSGEAAMRYLGRIQDYAVAENKFLLGCYYYQGLQSDSAMLEVLPQQRVMAIEEAEFILNGNFDYHGQPMAEIIPKLLNAASRNIPMLCINPDLEVVKQDGTQILCAGFLAAEYEKMGGRVGYIGKPHPLVFEMAMEEFSEVPRQRIAMIGDNLLTDIKGGKAAGLATILITQGVYKGKNTADGITPDYILPALRW